MPKLNVPVSRGMTHDGLGYYYSQKVQKAPGSTADIVRILRETKTDVVVNYLPVGSETATKWYVEQILAAGCAFVNCIPVFIGREEYWQNRFKDHNLPIIGDDIKSQVGATIVHRVLARLFQDRGVKLERTYQLNVGGNMDFYNMLERTRLESKKISKTNAVTSQLDFDLDPDNVHIGPSDHVPWLTDRKWAFIRLEGTSFGDVPLNVELKLEVWDSPNSAGRGDRCRPMRQAGAGPGHLRDAGGAIGVLHEVAADPALGRGRPRAGRGVHPRRGASRASRPRATSRRPVAARSRMPLLPRARRPTSRRGPLAPYPLSRARETGSGTGARNTAA